MAFAISHHTHLLCQVSAKSVDHNVWLQENFLRQWHFNVLFIYLPYLPSAVFIALMPVGLSKCLMQAWPRIWTWNDREQIQQAVRARLELGASELIAWDHALSLLSLYVSHEDEGMIHFFVGSHVKKPESGLFSDWIGNNKDDFRCSNWPKCRHPLVVVDFSLHFCLRNEQWIHTRVRYQISAGLVFLNLKNA